MFTMVSLFWSLLLNFVINAKSQACKGINCPNEGFCNPNTFQCAQNQPHVVCGYGFGDFINCSVSNYGSGVIMRECGSGSNADCSNQNGCGEDSYEAVECNYPEMAPVGGYENTGWHCGHWGSKLSCKDIGGSVLIGVCGSGKNEDCSQYCRGWHGILCAKSKYFNVSWDSCTWNSGKWGQWIGCNSGTTIAAGHCGCGSNPDCDGSSHQLQCCSLHYPY
eukprot:161303_1